VNNQTLSFTGDTLAISGVTGTGSQVDLSKYNQSLTLSGSELSISNGTGVTLPIENIISALSITPQYYSSGLVDAQSDSYDSLADVIDVEYSSGMTLPLKTGKVKMTTPHGYSTGATLYLSSTSAGDITTTKPTTGVVQTL